MVGRQLAPQDKDQPVIKHGSDPATGRRQRRGRGPAVHFWIINVVPADALDRRAEPAADDMNFVVHDNDSEVITRLRAPARAYVEAL